MTATGTAPDTSWMTPWEVWAWERIVTGQSADMEHVPIEARGGIDEDKEKVTIVFAADADGVTGPIDPELWPAWQILTARFVESVLTKPEFTSARKRPTVSFVSARIIEEIDLQDVYVASGITFSYCRFDVALKFYGASLRGSLNIFASHLAGGLMGDRMNIGGSFFLRQNSLCEGEIRLTGAEIASNIEILGSSCRSGEDGACISADSAIIKGNFYLSDGASCVGLVRLVTADIRGNLGINGAVLSPASNATHCLLADGASVGGAMMLRGGTTFDGDISMSGVRVEGQCQLSGSTFNGAVDFSSARIKDELRLDETSIEMPPPNWGPQTRINLQNARIGALQGSIGAWTFGNGFVQRNLDGLVVERLAGGAGGESLDRARPHQIIAWLERDTVHSGKRGAFSPSPYLAIANALETAGAADKARRVRIALEKRITREKSWFSVSAPNKFGRAFVMGPMTAYGYEPMRATWWFGGVAVAFAMLGLGWEFAPVAGEDPRVPVWRDLMAWLGFSLETALPLIDLDPVSDTFLEDRFGVSEDAFGDKVYAELPTGLRALFAFERILGLIIISVLIAGLTGWAETRGK